MAQDASIRPELTKHPSKKKKLNTTQQLPKLGYIYTGPKLFLPNINYNKNKPQKIRNKYLLQKKLDEIESLKTTKEDNLANLFGRIRNNSIELTIKSINTHGFTNNSICLNERIASDDIVAVTETMHGNIRTINKVMNDKSKQVFQKIGTRTASKGGYSGGQAFIVHENIKCSTEFIGDYLGILIVNNLVLINVYLKFLL